MKENDSFIKMSLSIKKIKMIFKNNMYLEDRILKNILKIRMNHLKHSS